MTKRNELSLEKRVKIQLLHEQGKSQIEISKTVKCSRRSVQYVNKRFAATGSHQNRLRSGCTRIIKEREDRVSEKQEKTSVLAAEFSVETNRTISARTTRRRLLEAGLKGCKARKKPWLSHDNKKSRYECALKYRSFTDKDWTNVLWSDESNFEVFGTPGVTFVRRRVGEEFKLECVVPTEKHGGGSIMVWSCMTDSGVGELFMCKGRMNSTKYKNPRKCVDAFFNKTFRRYEYGWC